MHTMLRTLTLLCCLGLLSPLGYSFNTVLISDSVTDINITDDADFLIVEDSDYSIQRILSAQAQRQFAPVHGDTLRNYQMNAATWLTLGLRNPTNQPQRTLVQVQVPFIRSAELYYDLDADDGYQRVATGSGFPFNDSPYQVNGFLLPIEVQPGFQQIYLKLVPIVPLNMQLRLVDENTLFNQTRSNGIAFLFAMFLLLLAAVLSVITFTLYRDPIALWAALMPVGFGVNLMGWTGYIRPVFGNLPLLDIAFINIGAFLIIFSFAKTLIRMHDNANVMSRSASVIRWLGRLAVGMLVLSLLPVTEQIISLQVLVLPLVLIAMAVFASQINRHANSTRLVLLSIAATVLFFTTTGLVLFGLASFFTLMASSLTVIGVFSSASIVLCGWILSRQTNSRMAVEGLRVPNIHWPVLRKLNHQLRGPINGVLGMSELLQETTLSAHQQEYLNTIQTSGFSLLREVDQLQNLIRVGLNRLPDTDEDFDLYDVVEETVQPFSRLANNKQLELVLDVDPRLPSKYRGNSQIIGQILANLLDNAMRYTEKGEVLVQVKAWQKRHLRFIVTDTGPGIAQSGNPDLFQFPDATKPDQQPKDVHLGLPITQYLVNLLGGQLGYQSELRSGTSFWFTLPMNTARASTTTRATPTVNLPENLRVMVLDDNLTCRKVIQHIMTSWGSEVFSISNPQSAIANLHNQFQKGEAIDLLFLDQNMPNISGLEVARRIRQDSQLNSNIAIVMMTGSDDLNSAIQTDLGLEHVLSKPVSTRALSQVLKSAIPSILKNRETKYAKKSLFS